jgi:hypothetical protein
MGFRFQKRIPIIPGLARINLSKSGVSASVGPRGADVNIGCHGVTTNAGIPGTGLSYRQKMGGGRGKAWVAALTLLAGLGVWAFQHWSKVEKMLPQAAPAAVTVPAATAMTPVNTGGSGSRYVHRAGSVLRAEPKTSAESLKKESKGAMVTLISQANGWAKVTDGDITGYMRASVLGSEPPR